MKKAFLFVCLCIVLCVPAFAETYHFTSADIQWIPLGNVDYGNSYVRANDTGVYFYVQLGADDNRPVVHAVSADNNKSASYWRSSTDTFVNLPIRTAWGNYYIASSGINFSPSEWNCVYPVTAYDSDVSVGVIQSDFASFLENPVEPGPAPTPGPSSSFRVPAGNVLYFQVDSEQDVTLDANMPKLSSFLFGGNPWGDSGIRYGPAASLPTSSTTFPILSQDAVSWSIKPPTNVLGQSRIGTASKRCIVGQWYALYLPSIFGLLDTSTDLDSSRYLPGASVDISGSFSQIKVYPLESQYNWSGADFVTGSADEYETYYDGSVDDNGFVTFTNQDGVVSTPPNGGSNQFDVDTNPLNLVETIKNILSNILKEIESLFTFGYDAIRSLVSIMSDFVSVFQGLYSWLPQPVYSALISAVTIAIVIGVFKVFL